MEKALAACVPNSLCPFWIDRDKPQLHTGQPGCSTCCLKGYKELVFCSFSGTVWRPGKRTEEFIQHPKRSSRDVSNSGTQILHYHLFPRLGQLHYQFPMNVFTSFHTWAIESQCRWPTKQCDLEILGLKSVKTQNLKPQKKYLNTKMLFWFPSLNHMSCPEHVLCRGAWGSFDQLLQGRNLFSTCSSTILQCSLQIIKIPMHLWYI